MTLPEGAKAELASGRLKPSPAGWYFGRVGAVPDVRPATTLFVNFPPAQSIRAVTFLRATPAGRAKPRMTQVPGIPSEDIGK